MKIYLIILIILFNLNIVKINTEKVLIKNESLTNSTEHHGDFKVVDWKYHELRNYIIYGTFIMAVVIMKVFYFHIPRLASIIPESCILLVVGIIFGVIIRYTLPIDKIASFKLTPELFFFILLPPIILESAYSLYHRNFLDNVLSILLFAVIGTILNFLLIGFSLYGFGQIGEMKKLNMTVKNSLLFSSLIIAVDPVAVLAIFQDVGVNQNLYYLVFGESLLNDAVTVVLYEIMQEFSIMPTISAKNIILGFISFFTVSFGGMFIGIIIGILSCIIIRFMYLKNTELFEPILLFTAGYISYILADLFAWSGIISATCCGLVQAAYSLNGGITDKSKVALKRFMKIIASICEAAIFLFLGIELAVGNLKWHTGFALTSLVLCLIVRFIVTFLLSSFVNKIHASLRNIPLREKFIISFGGLRGAVAFSLAVLLKDKALENTELSKEIIITTTLFIILFTIFIQGLLIKPLVSLLQIGLQEKQSKRLSLFDELNESIFDAVDIGIEAILGKCGRNYFYIILTNFSNHFLKPLLQRTSKESKKNKITYINEKINNIIISKLEHSESQLDNDTTLKALPDNYRELLTNIRGSSRKTTRATEVPPEYHPVEVEFRPIKRLRNVLLRTSSISLDDYDQSERILINKILTTTPTLMKAKNRFLKLKKIESGKELKNLVNDSDDYEGKNAENDNKNNDDEETTM